MQQLNFASEFPPLRQEANGSVRIGDSRVLLELVIHAFQDGATPESIVYSYSSLTLPDVYGVIAYYLRHKTEVDAYVRTREEEGDALQAKIEAAHPDMAEIRARLLRIKHERMQPQK